MASLVTLATLKAQALDMADMTGQPFPDDARLTDYANLALGELYDLLIESWQDYKRTVHTLTVVAGTEAYDLPTDFYKLIKAFALFNNRRYVLRMFNLDEIDKWRDDLALVRSDNTALKYRIMGSKILFSPQPIASGSVELWYIPELTKLTKDDEKIDLAIAATWEDFVSLSMAIRLKVREESDPSALMAMQQAAKARIISSAVQRDAGEPHYIADVSGRWFTQGNY